MDPNPPSLGPPSRDIVWQEKMVAMNEALILGSIHQHELTEAAERLNARLVQEIRQREEAERALRESEERFRGLFACAPMAVFACDRDAIIRDYNSRAAELWGREPAVGVERYCGSVRWWLPDGSPLPHAESPITCVLRAGIPALNIEFSLERPDASRVPVLANFAPLKNTRGHVTGAIVSMIDLTERKKLEQQSIRSQRMESLGTLAGGIAHDLNNSLAPIMMSLELLRLKLPDHDSRGLLTILESSAQRGADMVRQILSFARGMEGRRADVEVPTLIREIEKIVKETFFRNIQIEMRVAPDAWHVTGDATQLHQVLLNLCLNARDAMPNGGKLVISVENRQVDEEFPGLHESSKSSAGPYVMLEVKDTGFGIPSDRIERIFDPFFTTKEFGNSSGLGLSTALAIVRSHGGFFHVVSELGKGTIFQVFIPAKIDAPPAMPPLETNHPRGHGELILVVDDGVSMRRMARQILETFGYQVVLASDGAQAIAIYKARTTDIAVVITDMDMPVMNGLELIRYLRGVNPALPIIASSGLVSNYMNQLSSYGVDNLLPKPYTTAEFLTTIQRCLGATSAARLALPPSRPIV